MKKILAFFGAFNPPTVAHLDLAEFALGKTDSESVMFVPSKSAYIEGQQHKSFAYSDKKRLDMLSAAAKKRPWMLVSDIEICAERQPRTYDTLCRLREMGFSPSLLIGSDKLPELENGWMHVEKLAKEFGIVCLCRGDDKCECMIGEDQFLCSLSQYIRVIKTPESFHHISSSAVRRDLFDGGDIDNAKEMLTDEVLQLVMQKKENKDEA